MSFTRPALQDLVDRAVADITSRLEGADATLRRSNLNVLAKTRAGGNHELYGYLDWMFRQLFPDTAESEYLLRWATIFLEVPQKQATFAAGQVSFTGTNGAVILAGTVLQRTDGAEFTTDADVTVAAGVALVSVTALVAGVAGNTAGGSSLSLVSPVSGVAGTATVGTGGLVNGLDIESDDSIRSRLLRRLSQPPQGGADFDYVTWTLEVPGVTRAWSYPKYLGGGTVGLCFVMDGAPGGLIPDAATVSAVQAYIEARCSVIAAVTVFAPVAVPLNFTIQLTPNTAAVQTAVQAELVDLLSRENAPGGTILLSHIRQAISSAAGETDSALVAPAANVTLPAGQISVMGAITWQ